VISDCKELLELLLSGRDLGRRMVFLDNLDVADEGGLTSVDGGGPLLLLLELFEVHQLVVGISLNERVGISLNESHFGKADRELEEDIRLLFGHHGSWASGLSNVPNLNSQ
jgi:hypothetical protein